MEIGTHIESKNSISLVFILIISKNQTRGRQKEETKLWKKAKENANARWLIRVIVVGPAQHGIEKKKTVA